MNEENWVRSIGLDADGSLFVEIEKGIKLYDLCLNTFLPEKIEIHPKYLMTAQGRSLYYRFLTTLKEIEEIVYNHSYDRAYRFKKGGIVVDAGARIGTFAAKIAAAVGTEGKIVAIEPEPRNYGCLVKNIEANRLYNVIPLRKMLWSRTLSMRLYLSSSPAAHSAYCDPFYGSTGEFIEVEAQALDEILEELGIESVDFVKMDIEGSEIEALRGMKKLLSSSVQLAIAAYHPVQGKFTYTEISSLLEKHGFRTTYEQGIVRASR